MMASAQVVETSVNTQQQSFSGLHYKPGRSLKPQQIINWKTRFVEIVINTDTYVGFKGESINMYMFLVIFFCSQRSVLHIWFCGQINLFLRETASCWELLGFRYRWMQSTKSYGLNCLAARQKEKICHKLKPQQDFQSTSRRYPQSLIKNISEPMFAFVLFVF